MSDQRAVELKGIGDRLFNQKRPLHSYLQDIADNFYPERADFVRSLWLGQDLTAHLMDSYPMLCRRELGDAVSSMLRPRGRLWFRLSTGIDEIDEDRTVALWFEAQAKRLFRAIYHKDGGFVRASKMTDHDYVAFGNGVLSVEEDETRQRFRFRNWHFRDCAWLTNPDNEVDHMHRTSKMTARNMVRLFKNVSPEVKTASEKEPGKEFEVRHVMMPADEYDLMRKDGGGNGSKLPFASIYIDSENSTVLKEGGAPDFLYVTPRWHLVSNWQYGFSPASVISLPDSRAMQQMTRVILEHGEKIVDPPLIATEEAVRSDINIFPGGVTYISQEYDERMGEALRKLDISGNPQFGVDLRQDVRELMARAWYINKLTLPPNNDMTAFEVSQRVQEYVRTLLPFFEPIEVDYNGALLDRTFNSMMRHNQFDIDSMPDQLQNHDIEWKFESPLQAAEGRLKLSAFNESMQVIGGSAQMDQSILTRYDLTKMTDDAVRGTGAPADWFTDPDAAKQAEDAANQSAQLQQAAQMLQGGAQVGGNVADATMKMRQAGLLGG